MATGREVVGVNIDGRHLLDDHGVGEQWLSLSVLVARGIGFQFRHLRPLRVIVLEEAHQHLHRLGGIKVDGCALYACGVAIEDESLQAGQLRSNAVHGRVFPVLEKEGVFL